MLKVANKHNKGRPPKNNTQLQFSKELIVVCGGLGRFDDVEEFWHELRIM